MDKKSGGNFVLGVCGGIIFGALIHNMAIGLLLGFAVGFGLVKFNWGKPKDQPAAMPRVPVSIAWADWKLSNPPTGDKYSTVSRFPGDDAQGDLWSVTLYFDSMRTGAVWRGEAEFLSAEAQTSKLSSGAVFELLEGERVAAVVTVD